MTAVTGMLGIPRVGGCRRYGALFPAVLVFLAFTSCSGRSSSSSPAAPGPQPPPVVVVTMEDYRFDYDRDIPSERVVFRVHNAGDSPHQLTLFPLPEDVPPIEEQLRGEQRRFVEPFAGIYDRAPGDSGTFAVDLEPGTRYAMVCFLEAEDGEPHWMKGMASEFLTPSTPSEVN